MGLIREAAVAGMFYPSGKFKLADTVSSILESTRKELDFSNISGIIAPHAGYVYSGKTAGYAYNSVSSNDYKNIIIISPSHREYFPGISIYEGEAYSTPLGKVPLNKELVKKLVETSNSIFTGIQGHREEHGIEVHLPFLQMIYKDFSIIPIVMGDQGKIFIDDLAIALSGIFHEDTLIIASSDLSHFHSKEKANVLDGIVEAKINNFDYDGLQSDLEHNICEACGGGPIVAMMKALSINSYNKSNVLSRSDSGDITGDTFEVVGYLSAAVYKVN